MKFYELNSVFTFGKYQGKTVLEILELQPLYLDWCAINLDHFIMSKNVIDEMKKVKPTFSFSSEGLQKMDEKIDKLNDELENYHDYDGYHDDRNADYNQTDWSNYNDDLDMDQQGIEFWNQF